MSGLGHLAVALAAKPLAPRAPLLALIVASEANDLLYGLFTSAGMEPPAVIASMDLDQGVRYLAPVSDPLSHGVLMSFVWAACAAGIAGLVFRDRRTAGVFGLVVLSHISLDLIMHSNLPLFLEGSMLVGLGLENTGPGFLFMTALDLALMAIGLSIYFRARRRPQTVIAGGQSVN